jgi:transposase
MIIIISPLKEFNPMTYSSDFRRKALLIKEQDNLSFEATAKRFGVGKMSVLRWSKQIEAQRTRHKPATKIDMEALKRDVEQYPDAYQYERAERLGVSRRGIGYALKRLGISRKKNLLTSESRSRKTGAFFRADRGTSKC